MKVTDVTAFSLCFSIAHPLLHLLPMSGYQDPPSSRKPLPHPETETSMDGAWSLCNSVMKLELLITGSSGLGDPAYREEGSPGKGVLLGALVPPAQMQGHGLCFTGRGEVMIPS